mgnify:CR=1 FL=1
MKLDKFATRFYIFENIFDNKILTDVLNTIKEDAHYLSMLSGEPQGGPSYKTNFYIRDNHWPLFNPILEKLNTHLKEEESIFYQLYDAPWYSEYGEHDGHEPHVHDQKQINLMKIDNALKYSCIINLSNVGETSFLNPNYTSQENQFHKEQSNYGKVLLFPSNLWHWVSPHRYSGRTRATFSMNGLLHFSEQQ